MSLPKKVDALPFFKLGKAPAKRDPKGLRFRAVLRVKVDVPDEYDFDLAHSAVPTPMYLNDELGCCVISGRAHQTLRFELLDQKKLIQISDAQVRKAYLTESGGEDSGLIVRDSLQRWRKKGWKAGEHTLQIEAFAEIDPTSRLEVKRAIFLDVGCGVGLLLPRSAQKQLAAGKPWDVVSGASGKVNSWGGHYVYLSGYTKVGPVCVTWGRKQQMTWKFLTKYCDEAYGIIDDVTSTKAKKFLDLDGIRSFVEAADR